MSLQQWVVTVLMKKEGFQPPDAATLVGAHGIRVSRTGRPDALVFCPDADPAGAFGPDDLDSAIAELPGLQFVVVVRRQVDNSLYPYADSLGIPIYGAGDLKSALHTLDDISSYRGREETYIRSRLDANRSVSGYQRLGKMTFALERFNGLRPLTVSMVDDYEVTAEQVYAIVNSHPELALDAIVTSNPSCRSFAQPPIDAADATGVSLHTLADFLISLRDPWTV